MIYKIFTNADKIILKENIISMMQVSDKDFVPSLSARNSTLQKDLRNTTTFADGIYKYYDEMQTQEILGAFENDVLIGFVSFKYNYTNEIILQSELPNIYLSTLIINPEMRGKGITSNMYDYLFNQLYPKYNVLTRTWSTNIAHIKILYKFGFCEFYRKQNDRGNSIDTVYYLLSRNNIKS